MNENGSPQAVSAEKSFVEFSSDDNKDHGLILEKKGVIDDREAKNDAVGNHIAKKARVSQEIETEKRIKDGMTRVPKILLPDDTTQNESCLPWWESFFEVYSLFDNGQQKQQQSERKSTHHSFTIPSQEGTLFCGDSGCLSKIGCCPWLLIHVAHAIEMRKKHLFDNAPLSTREKSNCAVYFQRHEVDDCTVPYYGGEIAHHDTQPGSGGDGHNQCRCISWATHPPGDTGNFPLSLLGINTWSDLDKYEDDTEAESAQAVWWDFGTRDREVELAHQLMLAHKRMNGKGYIFYVTTGSLPDDKETPANQ